MAALNLSTNGAAISKSYQSVVNSSIPTGPSAASPTYGQWAVFSVAAPLVSAFQQGAGGKESVLKVQSTGEGELQDLVDEFSDGRIQFAFVKVKDSNSGLPKNALIGWCGEGVPERTKGYFSSHQAAVAKLLQGYHVQISARSDRDLTPEGIIQKVADASGAKYSVSDKLPSTPTTAAPPPLAKKPVFTPSTSNTTGSAFNPLANRRTLNTQRSAPLDDDGWGEDAPPVTRTQLERVAPAYKPTKVNISELTNQAQEPSKFNPSRPAVGEATSDVVKGSYQPVGKVDIAAIRRQAAESGHLKDDRPSPVTGSYEPVGKVDIAGIKARAQQAPSATRSYGTDAGEEDRSNSEQTSKSLAERSAAFQDQGRLAELPKPKVSNRIGSGAAFVGTKAPVPGQFGLQSAGPGGITAPMGAGRTFAESAGKSPAQIWAEKKAAQGGEVPPSSPPIVQPVAAQNSGGWKSGYEGKKWAPVQISQTGTSATSIGQQSTGNEDGEEAMESSADVSSIRDRFAQAPPPGPPALNVSNKPVVGGGVPMPGLPTRPREALDEEEDQTAGISTQVLPPPPPVQPRSPTPEREAEDEAEEASSPVRIAVPVARGNQIPVQDAHEEQTSPPPVMPHGALEQQIASLTTDDEPERGHDTARGTGATAAANTFGEHAVEAAQPGSVIAGKRAIAQYDYEKAEDNELELREGEHVTNIEMVDTDWWMGQNSRGETGLFPSNYVELVEEDIPETPAIQSEPTHSAIESHPAEAAPAHASDGASAIAQYDYEAAEDNELSFPAGAKITNIEFPDEDWWSGTYHGVQGLFPANFVELEK